MNRVWQIAAFVLLCAAMAAPESQPAPDTTLAHLIARVRVQARNLESSSGMRQGFQTFTAAYKLRPDEVSYSDYVMVRLLYEATRDAGFWNMHWSITDQPPNSDRVWQQWMKDTTVAYAVPTATAECDELSALYAFLVRRAGVHGVGLFWPYPNHTVAVWSFRPNGGTEVRVVVPTSQIFLDSTDDLGTRKFDPWKQKAIFEYKRRDTADSLALPQPLFDLFVQQMEKYGGASDATLQQLRYMRERVFLKEWTPEQAAREALYRKEKYAGAPPEDLAAFENFARDMRAPSAP